MQWLADFHHGGGTIMLVTHEEYAASYAQRTIQLKQGQLDDSAAASSAASV